MTWREADDAGCRVILVPAEGLETSLKDGTYTKVFDQNVRFVRGKGRRTMKLELHGSECLVPEQSDAQEHAAGMAGSSDLKSESE
ncbi:MAG: hypothetical protein QOD74_1702 [Variibacter sp.]|nr:hypothetical protein [Variibacter sp.]